MINYNYIYRPWSPPYTPDNWDEYLNQEFKLFFWTKCPKEYAGWYPNKPCHKVFEWHGGEQHIGWYDGKTDVHLMLNEGLYKCDGSQQYVRK